MCRFCTSILLCLGLAASGCLQTQHVEYHHAVQTGIAPDGHLQHTSQTELNERSWHGPWLGQPESLRP
jgi:hypothetical protein